MLLFASVLALWSFARHGRQGINLADEGFLWYGVQRTLAGDFPLLDFQAYDPGRYYWCALGGLLYGKGLVALRFSESLFQILGLWIGLLTASRISQDSWFIAAVGVVLLIWMFPSYKLFDHTFLLCGVWIAVRLIEEPSFPRIFAAGAFLGVCVFFGRNHALYNLLAQGALFLVLQGKLSGPYWLPEFGIWIAGIATGLLPMILLCLCVPGFASSYLDSIISVFRNGTNLALPIPWPWRVSPFASASNAIQFSLGLFLVALPLEYLVAILIAISARPGTLHEHSVFWGSAFVGIFYLHHAFSRADFSHLAQVIHPFILGTLAWPCALCAGGVYRASVITILIVAAWVTVRRQTARFRRCASAVPWVPLEAGGWIYVPQRIEQPLTGLRKFAAENISPEDGVLIVPSEPGLYPILGLKSPFWNLAFYFAAAEQQQQEMIHHLKEKNVNWIILSDMSANQSATLRFFTTHPLLVEHLNGGYEPVKQTGLPKSTRILRRKS